MDLTIIVAVSKNNVIGFKGKIPWEIPEDLKRFQRLTLGHPVIMGENTFFSIMNRNGQPLPKRKNIVLSETLEQKNGIYVARNIREAIGLAENQDAYVIGGERVYREFLHLATGMELTRVHVNFEGDAFFPEINEGAWNLTNKEDGLSKQGIPYSFLTYHRM